MGETCGLKIVMNVEHLQQKCRLCDKIDTKQRRRAVECDRIARWKRDGGKFRVSIEVAQANVEQLDVELLALEQGRTSTKIHTSKVGNPKEQAITKDVPEIDTGVVTSKSLSVTNAYEEAKTKESGPSQKPQVWLRTF